MRLALTAKELFLLLVGGSLSTQFGAGRATIDQISRLGATQEAQA